MPSGADRPGRSIKRIKDNHAMKLSSEPIKKVCDEVASGMNDKLKLNKPEAIPQAGVPKRFRRLKWNEVVNRGDFVEDEHRGLEPWEGLGGFQADSFVKPIYRETKTVRPQPKKPK